MVMQWAGQTVGHIMQATQRTCPSSRNISRCRPAVALRVRLLLLRVLDGDDVRLVPAAGDVADEVLHEVAEGDAQALGDRRQVHLLRQAARAGDDFDSDGHVEVPSALL